MRLSELLPDVANQDVIAVNKNNSLKISYDKESGHYIWCDDYGFPIETNPLSVVSIKLDLLCIVYGEGWYLDIKKTIVCLPDAMKDNKSIRPHIKYVSIILSSISKFDKDYSFLKMAIMGRVRVGYEYWIETIIKSTLDENLKYKLLFDRDSKSWVIVE